MAIYSFLGGLCKLQTSGVLDDLEEISGSSAGCLAAVMFGASRTDLTRMMEYAFDIDVQSCTRLSVIHLFKKYGLIKLDTFRSMVSKMFVEFFGVPDVTFKEYHKHTDIKLHIPAFSIHKRMTQYFSFYSSPEFSVIDAMCMSISIPILMSPYKGYLDGSITEDIPYIPFIDKPTENVAVIRTREVIQTEYKNLTSYIFWVVGLFLVIRAKCPIMYKTYFVNTGSVDLFNFKLSHFEKMQLYASGHLSL